MLTASSNLLCRQLYFLAFVPSCIAAQESNMILQENRIRLWWLSALTKCCGTAQLAAFSTSDRHRNAFLPANWAVGHESAVASAAAVSG